MMRVGSALLRWVSDPSGRSDMTSAARGVPGAAEEPAYAPAKPMAELDGQLAPVDVPQWGSHHRGVDPVPELLELILGPGQLILQAVDLPLVGVDPVVEAGDLSLILLGE